MKHLKTFENWFTNIFKSTDMWEDYMDDHIGSIKGKGYNALMSSAHEGNWTRFKDLLNNYDINSVHTDYNDDNTPSKSNVLFSVIYGKGDLWEKKKMISALIEKGIDIYFENENGENFYEKITEPKLKKWIDEKYPDLEQSFLAKKYNI